MDILKLIPIESFLPIIASLIATIFALTLKIADLKRTLKHTEEESASARAEIKSLNERFNKEISDIKELHIREMEEISRKSAKPLDGIHTSDGLLWRPNDETPFCLRCYEVDNKSVHMKFRQYRLDGNTVLKWTCPNFNCARSTEFSEHPDTALKP